MELAPAGDLKGIGTAKGTDQQQSILATSLVPSENPNCFGLYKDLGNKGSPLMKFFSVPLSPVMSPWEQLLRFPQTPKRLASPSQSNPKPPQASAVLSSRLQHLLSVALCQQPLEIWFSAAGVAEPTVPSMATTLPDNAQGLVFPAECLPGTGLSGQHEGWCV